MTLQQINYALAVAETGSLNRAAEQLYLAEPSLRSAIQELESEIGIRIFHSTSRGIVTTAEGSEFLSHARALYEQYELLRTRYSDSSQIKKKFSVSTQHYSFVVKAFVETVKRFDSLQFDFSVQETRTRAVIRDVAELRSEIGILYQSDYNKKAITKLLNEKDLVFHPLYECNAFVYLWKGHPLAGESSLSLAQLEEYPCLLFDQGEESSAYYAEELLPDHEYPRRIKTNDRASNLNLMVGLNGFTLCSGIISEELNGDDFITIPFREEGEYQNEKMTIGYIVKKQSLRSEVGEVFLEELKRQLQ